MSDADRSAPGDGRIVVGIDGSPTSLRALEWAARQAELTGSVLEPIVAWEWPTSYGWAVGLPAEFSPEADAKKVLDEAVAPVLPRTPRYRIEARVVEGHPAPVLVEASNGSRPRGRREPGPRRVHGDADRVGERARLDLLALPGR